MVAIQRVDRHLPPRETQREALQDLFEAVSEDFRVNPSAQIGGGTIITLVYHLQMLDARITALEAERGR